MLELCYYLPVVSNRAESYRCPYPVACEPARFAGKIIRTDSDLPPYLALTRCITVSPVQRINQCVTDHRVLLPQVGSHVRRNTRRKQS